MRKRFLLQQPVLLFFVFTAALIATRFVYTGQPRFFFLVWNLFLAWVPFTISDFFEAVKKSAWWKQLTVFCLWLLFFPNALYVVTDLIHLKATGTAPLWYDALLLFSAAVAALAAGFLSLLRAELFLQNYFTRRTAGAMAVFIILLGSFGVYLGRFLRWNSWDVFQQPAELLLQIAHRVLFPFQHGQTWGSTFLLFSFFGLLWFFIKKMPGYFTGHSLNNVQ